MKFFSAYSPVLCFKHYILGEPTAQIGLLVVNFFYYEFVLMKSKTEI